MAKLTLNATSINHTVSYNYGYLSTTFILNVSLYSNQKVLEIDDKYLFLNNKYPSAKTSNKNTVSGQLTINRKSSESKKYLTLNNFDENKIGEVIFLEPYSEQQGCIVFQMFVDDNYFDLIENHFIQKLPISSITLEVKEILYGWQPDNSVLVWKLEEVNGEHPTNYKKLDIKEFTLVFEGESKLM